MLTTAPHEAAGESLAVANDRYRASLRRCAHRLADLDPLRDGIELDEATSPSRVAGDRTNETGYAGRCIAGYCAEATTIRSIRTTI
jgi:hypothetical protein